MPVKVEKKKKKEAERIDTLGEQTHPKGKKGEEMRNKKRTKKKVNNTTCASASAAIIL